jgi:hypothetical protein
VVLDACVLQETTPILETGEHSIIGSSSLLKSRQRTWRKKQRWRNKKENYFSSTLKNSPINSCPENINTYTFRSHHKPPPPPHLQLSWFILLLRLDVSLPAFSWCASPRVANSIVQFWRGHFYLYSVTYVLMAHIKAPYVIQIYFTFAARIKCINPLENQSEMLKQLRQIKLNTACNFSRCFYGFYEFYECSL